VAPKARPSIYLPPAGNNAGFVNQPRVAARQGGRNFYLFVRRFLADYLFLKTFSTIKLNYKLVRRLLGGTKKPITNHSLPR